MRTIRFAAILCAAMVWIGDSARASEARPCGAAGRELRRSFTKHWAYAARSVALSSGIWSTWIVVIGESLRAISASSGPEQAGGDAFPIRSWGEIKAKYRDGSGGDGGKD